MVNKNRRASELEWLRWFYQFADFGPRDEEIRKQLKETFKVRRGLDIPEGYTLDDE
jgi:hypothetical protein